MAGASGARLEAAAPLFFLGDLACLGVLISMARRAPVDVPAPTAAAAAALPEAAPDASSSYEPVAAIVESEGR